MSAGEVRRKAIEATVARMRQHGFDKVRLSDVAKDLGVSHAALYPHFADKAALLDAVTHQWLDATDAALGAICESGKDPVVKIRAWFLKRYRLKRERVLQDPELYRAFNAASERRKPFVIAHLAEANRQLVGLLKEARGRLGPGSPQKQADLLVEAMAAFHHPKLVTEHLEEKREPQLKRVLDTLLAGMAAGG
ncbi:TetR/AcrR family transcriptional regulator [Pelomonas sp. KK5]|uniref:TetR/AcrR family transcriptional regulator n=1 Tax=Pelomonas sp. KK5 TaxID=1855730 RepID=UPI001301B8EA|nr:TetR/AcrR family transcriptional regulator [Pelomonas sp. KK5]